MCWIKVGWCWIKVGWCWKREKKENEVCCHSFLHPLLVSAFLIFLLSLFFCHKSPLLFLNHFWRVLGVVVVCVMAEE